MSKKSPVLAEGSFSLPFSAVVGSTPASVERSSDPELDRLNATVSMLASSSSPIARTNCFLDLGVARHNKGIQHTLYFSRRPVGNQFELDANEFKVSGYLSYSYLRSGSMVAGLIFSTDRAKTKIEDYKLVVKGKGTPRGFAPNFNLEKMGLLLFIAEDSSTLVIPNDIDSGLLVRAD